MLQQNKGNGLDRKAIHSFINLLLFFQTVTKLTQNAPHIVDFFNAVTKRVISSMILSGKETSLTNKIGSKKKAYWRAKR